MRDRKTYFFVTNKDIHDILSSAKQRLTEKVLQEMLRERGIFCSPSESREKLVDRLAVLIHDYKDILAIVERQEHARRNEKSTTTTLGVTLTQEELKDVVSDYQASQPNESVAAHKRGQSEYVMNLGYDEIDYSKTRLLQRQPRDAAIEFFLLDGQTLVRMPATEKAREVIKQLKTRIEAKKKQPISTEDIELTKLDSTAKRTLFFTKLISTLPNFGYLTVSKLRVAHGHAEDDGQDGDLDDVEVDADQEIAGIVHNVALNGEHLVESQMFKDLCARGFYITSITWRAREKTLPYKIIECHAGFEDREGGTRFRYSIQGALRFKGGEYTKNLQYVEDAEKATLLTMIETTARNVLKTLVVDDESAESTQKTEEESKK